MASDRSSNPHAAATAPVAAACPAGARAADTRFVNAMRLTSRQWLAFAVVLAIVLLGTPWLWKRYERFEPSADYRIPYDLSKDYWHYERALQLNAPSQIAVIGDSVIWGEYVRPDGTLSHFLNEPAGSKTSGRFVNAGVNGLFPLALEGLIRHYGGSLRRRKVLLHCNVLWLTSPKADLSTDKEERFNHADLVPQFSPRIPCYKADLNRRLAAVVERNFPFSQWANHLQVAYFGQKNVQAWTLEDDGGQPPRFVNAGRNPIAQLDRALLVEPANDPDRGPTSARHKAWSTTGQGSTRFAWVELDRSLQWQAFQRLVQLLRSRGNDVLVVVGPFNEHIMAPENQPMFRQRRDGITQWLAANQIAHVIPETLPSVLYADGSHPLTEGYRLLASRIVADPTYQKWRRFE